MAGQCAGKILSGERKGQPCRRSATNGTEHDGKLGFCSVHGGRLPGIKAAAARRRALREAEAAIALEAEKTGREAAPNQSPLSVLEDSLNDMVRLKQRLGAVVERLTDESLRYEGRAGENIRGELQMYSSVLRDTVAASEKMLKLGIAERRLELDQRAAVALLWIVEQALQRFGLDADNPEIRSVVSALFVEAGDRDEQAHARAAIEARRR